MRKRSVKMGSVEWIDEMKRRSRIAQQSMRCMGASHLDWLDGHHGLKAGPRLLAAMGIVGAHQRPPPKALAATSRIAGSRNWRLRLRALRRRPRARSSAERGRK